MNSSKYTGHDSAVMCLAIHKSVLYRFYCEIIPVLQNCSYLLNFQSGSVDGSIKAWSTGNNRKVTWYFKERKDTIMLIHHNFQIREVWFGEQAIESIAIDVHERQVP